MARKGRFYFERVSKMGMMSDERIIEAISDPISIASKKFAWTITDHEEGELKTDGESHKYYGGHLSKYDPIAVVELIDEKTNTVVLQPEPNMKIASSQFVYLPDLAVLSYRHIWDKITAIGFRDKFCSLIKSKYRDFFVDIELHPISDKKIFYQKVAELESVSEIKARVTPPNPLFGPLWKELKEQIIRRNAQSLSVQEIAQPGKDLNTDLPRLAKEMWNDAERLLVHEINDIEPSSNGLFTVSDAALLMASDGYGRGEISGIAKGVSVTFKTSDNAVLLKLPADVSIEELAEQTHSRAKLLIKQGRLQHGK